MRTICLFVVSLASCIVVQAQAPSWQWAVGGNNTADAEGWNITVDIGGNTYVTGTFSGTLYFDTLALESAGSSDIFIAKYDAAGVRVWAKRAGGGGIDGGAGVVTDASGNVYVCGSFSDTADFSGIALTSSGVGDIFLAKYDNSGDMVWVKQAGGIYDDEAKAICLDKDDNIYVTGFFAGNGGSPPVFGTANFETTILTSKGGHDVFLSKYNNDGDLIWAKGAGGVFFEMGMGIGTDTMGHVYISGYFSDPYAYFDTLKLYSISSGTGVTGNLFIAQYDSSGMFLWAKTAGGIQTGAGGCSISPGPIAVSPSGNIYNVGNFYDGILKFESYNLTGYGDDDVYIAKFNSAGSLVWARNAGWYSYDYGTGIAIDRYENVYITGSYNQKGIFGDDTLTGMGAPDIFAAKYDKDGMAQWAQKAGGSGYEFGKGIAADDNGNVFITGSYYSGTVSFGSHSFWNYGGSDVFVAKLHAAPSGIPGAYRSSDRSFVYPNPAQDRLTVVVPAAAKNSVISITDIAGRCLYRQKLTEVRTVIDLERLAPGMYLYRIVSDDGAWVQGKLVKQ